MQIFTSNQHHDDAKNLLICCICRDISETDWCETAECEIERSHIGFTLRYICHGNSESLCQCAYPSWKHRVWILHIIFQAICLHLWWVLKTIFRNIKQRYFHNKVQFSSMIPIRRATCSNKPPFHQQSFNNRNVSFSLTL